MNSIEREWLIKDIAWGMSTITLCLLIAGCPQTKPIVQTQVVEVPRYIRAPIPAQYTVDRIVAEPKPACGALYCNGQVAMLLDDYRQALKLSNLDKDALRSLQPSEDSH